MKSYTASNDEIQKIADDLGLAVTFNSENPGVYNTTTGECRTLESYFPELRILDEEANV